MDTRMQRLQNRLDAATGEMVDAALARGRAGAADQSAALAHFEWAQNRLAAARFALYRECNRRQDLTTLVVGA